MKNDKNSSPLVRLIKLIHSERDDILLLLYLTLGYGLLSIATPVAVQALVNNVTMGGVIEPLVVISIILFALLVLSGFLYVLEAYVKAIGDYQVALVDTAYATGTLLGYSKLNFIE